MMLLKHCSHKQPEVLPTRATIINLIAHSPRKVTFSFFLASTWRSAFMESPQMCVLCTVILLTSSAVTCNKLCCFKISVISPFKGLQNKRTHQVILYTSECPTLDQPTFFAGVSHEPPNWQRLQLEFANFLQTYHWLTHPKLRPKE